MSFIAQIIKPIQDEADREAAKILSGKFSNDHLAIHGAIERRKGLLKAIELVKERAKRDED